MPLEIVLNEEPPRQLLHIIQLHYNDENLVNRVTIDINNEKIGKESLGAFFPNTKEIVIDLAHCLTSKGWMGFGMMMIQTVWFNMLRAVFHELGHALQLDRDPDIEKMLILTPQLEHEADSFATIMIQKWVETGGVIPKINDMGWAGDQIKLLINTCYSNKELRPKILEELEVLEANGVAEVNTFTTCNKELLTKETYDTICKSIDNKTVGIKINNKRYLDTIGFFKYLLAPKENGKDRLKTELIEYYISEEPPEENANKVSIDNVIKS